MSKNKVAITGFCSLSSLSDGFKPTSNLQPLIHYPLNYKNKKYEELLSDGNINKATQYVIIAIQELIDKFPEKNIAINEQNGLLLGSIYGCLNEQITYCEEYRVDGVFGINPVLFTKTTANAPAGYAAIHYKFKGINLSFVGDILSSVNGLCVGVDYLSYHKNPNILFIGGYEIFSSHLTNICILKNIDYDIVDRISVLSLEQINNAKKNNNQILGQIIDYSLLRTLEKLGNKEAIDIFLKKNNISKDSIKLVILCGDCNSDTLNKEKADLSNIFADSKIVNINEEYGYSGSDLPIKGLQIGILSNELMCGDTGILITTDANHNYGIVLFEKGIKDE